MRCRLLLPWTVLACCRGSPTSPTPHIQGTSGVLQSENHPDLYSNNIHMTHTITVADSERILLEFTTFAVEYERGCNYDYVRVLDKDGTELMGKTCGFSLPPTITSRTNVAAITFVTDSNTISEGWRVVWRAVPGTRLLLTGGRGSRSDLSSTEVYPRGCSSPPLPEPLARHVTFTTVGSSPVVATCGGLVDRTYLASCLVLQDGQWRTGIMSDLPEPRSNAATASLAAGTFLLGGSSTSLDNTSAFLASDSMAWEEGPALPLQDMFTPCAAQISPTSFLILSGKTILEFDSSVAGPRGAAGWRPAGTWPDLLTERRNQPGCAVVGCTLIIAGGWGGGWTTETLDLATRTISPGPSMARPRSYFHLVTLPGPRILAIGGWDTRNNLESLEELVDGAWVEAAALEARRGSFGAVAVPEGLVCK